MEKIIAMLDATLAVDKSHESMGSIVERFEANIRDAKTSQTNKDSFLKGFLPSVRVGLDKRSALTSKETEWERASVDLYEFAIKNRTGYSIQRGKLVFRDDAMLAAFNQKMQRALDLQTDFRKVKKELEAESHSALGKVNVQPSDLGIPPEAGAVKTK